MNRSQKRAFVKNARKNGMEKHKAEAFVEIMNGTGEHTEPQEIEEGEKVWLNIEAIKARKNYAHMSPMYKEFIEKSEGVVFTAHIEQGKKTLISLIEEPKWLFWSGDLVRVNSDRPYVEELKDEV